MSITIYWACNDDLWLRANAPELIYKKFIKNPQNQKNNIVMCPATKDYMKNIFSINSLFDYNFKIGSLKNKNEIFTETYNQKFFNDYLLIRSAEDKLFSLLQGFCFFTEEKSLLMSAGILPFLEDNNITKRCTVIPGVFDIGKWFREIEFAFYLKKEYDEFIIEENEIFQYIKFHTDQKIIFKQFKINSKIKNFLIDSDNAKMFRKNKLRPLSHYYLMVKHKKYIINEIKNNLVD
jgi:hypothetical protein